MKVLDIPSSGKRGQVVAYISPYGQCQRALVVPKNTSSESRSYVRGAFGKYARAWSGLLTQRQRDAWDAAGPKVKTAKRLTSGQRTGQLHFQSINSVRARVGLLAPLLDPPEPVIFGPNPVGRLVITNGEDGARLFLNLSAPAAEDVMVYGQAPCSAGRRKRRRVVYLGLLPAPADGSSEITALYTARFGEPRPGEKVFIVTCQQKNGWQDFEHETSEIVPPVSPAGQAIAAKAEPSSQPVAPLPPPSSQASPSQSSLGFTAVHTGCTTVAQRLLALPAPDCRGRCRPGMGEGDEVRNAKGRVRSAGCGLETAPARAEVDEDRTVPRALVSGKTPDDQALQPESGGVRSALMKRNPSSEKPGCLDNTPRWDEIQTCLITC